MNPTNHRDEHVDVRISREGRAVSRHDALEEAKRKHMAQGNVESYVQLMMLQHDMRPNKEI